MKLIKHWKRHTELGFTFIRKNTRLPSVISDVFDAITTDRIYREGMLPHEGLEILYAEASTKFDIQMVDVFKKSVAIYPTGLTVTLSDNRTAVIVGQNTHANDRPNSAT